MLKKFLTAFMSAVLAVLPLNTAYANKNEQKNYIVKYKSSNISLMSIVKEKDHFDVVDEKTLNKLLNNNAVEWYEEDYDVELFEDNVDDSEKNQNTEAPPEKYDESKWDLKMIEAEFTYMLNCEGQEVKIGVIDSGVAEHEDLIGNISEGYNYIDESTDTSDTYGHGTFVSGIIASLDDGKGIIGLSPQAKIVPLKCFDEKTTKASYICKAIYGAVDDYDCDIINMSFGLSEDMQALKEAVDYAVNKGVIIVAAVGNSGGETLYYPAAYENVIGVGAVDKNGDISSVSEHNESVFITAPGKDINSTNYKGGYTTGSGTSYSTPFISSAVAIMKNVNDEINLDEIKSILSVSSVDKGNEGYDEYYGYGILNMKNCVREIIKDSVCFISPIDKKGEEISAVIYNNTDTDFTGLFITGEYNGKRINTLNKTDLTVSAGKTAEIKEKQSDYSVKYYVWNSLEDNTILSNVRNIETEKTEEIPEDYITITIDLSEYADKKYFSLSVNGYDGTLVYAVQDKIPQNYIYEISVPHNAVIDNNTEEKLCAVYLDSKINGIETSIPADAHNYESTIIPPNKAEKGYTEYTCKVCGYKYIDNETEPIGYFVEYDANGGESAPKKQNKRPEETLILPDDVPIREGYTFKGWSSDKTAEIPEYAPGSEYNSDEDIILYAVWSVNTYKLTYIVNEEEYKTVNIKFGEKIISEDAPTKSGYRFSGWQNLPNTMPAKDITVSGTFTKKSSGGGGGGSISSSYKPPIVTPVQESADKQDNNIDTEENSEKKYEKDYIVELFSFSDVSENDWFYNSVKFVTQNNLMNGISDAEFAPQDELTRAMFVTVLYRMDKEPEVIPKKEFSDVNSDDYYANAVQWAASNKIVTGISDTEFAPDKKITREQMAAVIYRYAIYKGLSVKSNDELLYKDIEDISDFALNAVKWANSEKLLLGNENGFFYPKKTSSRAEAATLFMRLYECDILKYAN